MSRPQIVDLILADFGRDAEPIEKYIVDLEQECYQLKELLNNIEKVIDGDPSNIHAFSEKKLAEYDAQVIRDFCRFALKKYRYDLSSFADEFNQLLQKAQENTNDKED